MEKRPTFIFITTNVGENSEDDYRGLTEQELDEMFSPAVDKGQAAETTNGVE